MGRNEKEKYRTYMVFKAPKDENARIRQKNLVFKLKKFLKELRKVYNIEAAAARCGLKPSTVFYYMTLNDSFRERVQEIRHSCRGQVEGRLYEEAMAGKPVPMIYFLKNNTDKYKEYSKRDMMQDAKQFFMPWAPAALPAPDPTNVIDVEAREVIEVKRGED